MSEKEPSLEALASFGQRLNSVYFLGGPESSGAVDEFVDMVYRTGWVDTTFDWTAWEQGRALFLDDQNRIASATPDELRMLITAIARMDRFSEGYLNDRFEDGTLRVTVSRAAMLATGVDKEQ